MTPAPSQTLTSLHVCRFSLSCGCKPFTMVVHKASLLHLLSPRDPCSERPGGLQMLSWSTGGWGMLWGRGAAGKDPERGASGCALLLVLRQWAFCAYPSPLGWCLPLAQPPCRQQTTHPSPAPAMVPVSYKSWMGTKHGQEVVKTPTPDLHQSRTQASHSHSLTHSFTPTVPWCGLTQPLIYEPSTWLVGWWLLF